MGEYSCETRDFGTTAVSLPSWYTRWVSLLVAPLRIVLRFIFRKHLTRLAKEKVCRDLQRAIPCEVYCTWLRFDMHDDDGSVGYNVSVLVNIHLN